MSDSLRQEVRPGSAPRYVVFGIGNCGRGDDGLGWAFLDRIQKEPGFSGQVEYRYQMQPEDAALISRAERIVFVDSYRGNLSGGFQLKHCKPSGNFEFTSHVLPPRAVMYLCKDLYGRAPRADLLMIRGCSWDLRNGMSHEAQINLVKAVRFFKDRFLGAIAA